MPPAYPSNSGGGTNYIVSAIIALITSGAIAITATSLAFSGLTSATNSSAAMVVGTGASLAASGSGTIAATKADALAVSGQTGKHFVAGLTSTDRIMTVPDAAFTVARTDAANTFTGVQTMTSPVFTTPALGTVASGVISACTSTSMALTTPVINSDTITAAIQHLAETTTAAAGYTLVLTDDCKVITVNTAGANTLSIPTNASVAFPVGTQIVVTQKGAGQWTIQATNSGTTTVVSNGGTAAAPKLRVQYSSATLWKDATDHWYVWGDIQ